MVYFYGPDIKGNYGFPFAQTNEISVLGKMTVKLCF